jgi:hypothetical protein
MTATHKSPETFFAILRTVKSIQENYHKINQEIRAEFGPEPEECMDFHASWLSQYQTNLLSQLLYWKEELYEQINNN